MTALLWIFWKAPVPMVFALRRVVFIVTVLSTGALANALLPMDFMEAGSKSLASFFHPFKACLPILVTLLGSTIFVKDVHL